MPEILATSEVVFGELLDVELFAVLLSVVEPFGEGVEECVQDYLACWQGGVYGAQGEEFLAGQGLAVHEVVAVLLDLLLGLQDLLLVWD